MNKINGIVNGLKFVLKFGVYIMAIVKIVEFAVATLEELKPQKKLEDE
ncbi:hypothetical protein [Flavobacterium sp. ZB4P13]